jgi:hypothetical protein
VIFLLYHRFIDDTTSGGSIVARLEPERRPHTSRLHGIASWCNGLDNFIPRVITESRTEPALAGKAYDFH